MKKSILNLEGVEQLSKNEKKRVAGGKGPGTIGPTIQCNNNIDCPFGYHCVENYQPNSIWFGVCVIN